MQEGSAGSETVQLDLFLCIYALEVDFVCTGDSFRSLN